MPKRGKKYRSVAQKVSSAPAPAAQAIALAKELAYAGFDETVELHLTTNADPRHAEQQVREVTSLPHGTGKTVRVMVFAEGDAAAAAAEAGADLIGDSDAIKRIEGGWSDWEVSIATPDQMGKIGRLGRYLGRKGLMPNPRTGTVVQPQDIAEAIRSAKRGRLELRMDRTAIIHAPIGKVSFDDRQLLENLATVVDTVTRARPEAVKGQFLKSATITTTMGPGIKVDLNDLQALRVE